MSAESPETSAPEQARGGRIPSADRVWRDILSGRWIVLRHRDEDGRRYLYVQESTLGGTAAGDLPYSIEDVPYVQFFHKAFALHGAFWHGNYGVQMSHGCVNLAPLDAKWLFFFTSPTMPAGFHGAWARPENSGTRIVIHE